MREKRLADARVIAEQSLTPAQRNATRQAVRAMRLARLCIELPDAASGYGSDGTERSMYHNRLRDRGQRERI